MYFSEFELENYKSIHSSGSLLFTPGFNVIVGRNNVGKTALVEGLSLTFGNDVHHSPQTVPFPGAALASVSQAHCTVHLNGSEIRDSLLTQSYINVRLHTTGDQGHSIAYFNALFTTGADLEFRWEPGPGGIHEAQVRQYPEHFSRTGLRYVPQRDATQWNPGHEGPFLIEERDSFTHVLVNLIRSRIYAFKAERPISGEAPIAPHGELTTNASNLATVLHYLQTNKPYRFDQFKGLVQDVFPHIQQIRIPPVDGTRARIYIGTIEPSKGREDLDIPLAASGTGIGQVLAMLYVVFTAEFPRIIVIDEPQSFLHPGAIYRLFDILKTTFPQHQYIVTTHSPAVIAAAEPTTSFLLTWSQGETAIAPVDYAEATGLSDVLAELGVRLTDIFGADRLLWVEGATEERCFPLIYRTLTRQSLGGTRILGVLNTGDFDSKDPDRILKIYERLSQENVLTPPTVGFLFDREMRTQAQREDWTRRSKGALSFLERRMYENYLLEPAAIADVLTHADPSGETHVTASDVDEWLRSHGQSAELLPQNARCLTFQDEAWHTEVDGARVLKTLFEKFSKCRVAYGKIQHGIELTRWFLEHKPETLQPIADAMRTLLQCHPVAATLEHSA
jgi:predicted ATPase